MGVSGEHHAPAALIPPGKPISQKACFILAALRTWNLIKLDLVYVKQEAGCGRYVHGVVESLKYLSRRTTNVWTRITATLLLHVTAVGFEADCTKQEIPQDSVDNVILV
jgi:hypothetical protein